MTYEFEIPMQLHCSQTSISRMINAQCLRSLWNCTALKPAMVYIGKLVGLRSLWNCTALKQMKMPRQMFHCLRSLWNCTALKRVKGKCTAEPV